MNFKQTTGLLTALVAMSAGAASAEDKTLTIGMANLLYGAPYFAGMDTAVHREADAYSNVEVISTDAGFDAAKMASDIEDLIAKGIDGLIVSAGPTETIPSALIAIEEAGIPVVFVDRLWQNTDLSTPWNWVGAENDVMGNAIGEHVEEHLGGTGHVLVIKGGPADNSIGLARSNGFIDAVSSSADIEVTIAPGFGNWGLDGGYTLMSDMLALHDDLNAVFCENDAMCLGAQKAAADAGRSADMVFAASDASKETLWEMQQEGTNFIATAVNDSDEIGRVGFNHLMGLLAGAKLPNITPLYSGLVLKEEAVKRYDPKKVF